MPRDNKIHVSHTGDIIYKEYSYLGYEMATLTSALNEPYLLGAKFEAYQGSKFIAIVDTDGKKYCSKEKYYIDPLIGPYAIVCLKDTDGDSRFDKVSSPTIMFGKFFEIKTHKPSYNINMEQISPNGFKKELIYNGYSNNTIYIQYREFLNDLARPAFYQELKYQYTGQPITIRYKKIKIKILYVDNNSIKFRLL